MRGRERDANTFSGTGVGPGVNKNGFLSMAIKVRSGPKGGQALLVGIQEMKSDYWAPFFVPTRAFGIG